MTGAFPVGGREREWIEWILPIDRPGYRGLRELISAMSVIGEGRRGPGELILGPSGASVDFSSPLAPVFAYGVIETDFGAISITVREPRDGQVSVEIVSQRQEKVPAEFEEARRWTYSAWSPGSPCPQCGDAVREVPLASPGDPEKKFVIALCPRDKRLWVYESASGVNRPIPVTNYYNELMLHKNIRKPEIALHANLLFQDLDRYTDDDLGRAFLTYNKLMGRVQAGDALAPVGGEKSGLLGRLKRMLGG